MQENGYERNDMELKSAPGEFTNPQNFHVFIRRTLIMPENFSIGLQWLSPEGKRITLLRCNGLHGKNQHIPHHRVPHIHRLSIEDVKNEIYEPKHTEQTKEYLNLEGAIPFFLQICHILDGDKDFPQLREINLFELPPE